MNFIVKVLASSALSEIARIAIKKTWDYVERFHAKRKEEKAKEQDIIEEHK